MSAKIFLGVVLLIVIITLTATSLSASDEPGGTVDSWIAPEPLPKGAEPKATLAAVLAFAPSYGVNPRWMYWTAYLESRFVPSKIGDHGKSFGLCQIQQISVDTLLEAGYSVSDDWQFGVIGNIHTACQYGQWLLQNFEIPDAGAFREIWTLGPSSYFEAGNRNPSERRNFEALLA